MSEKVKHIERFNRAAKLLAVDLRRRFPADARALRVSKQIILATDVTPTHVLDTVGPHIFGYRDQIAALEHKDPGAMEFFLAHEFATELASQTEVAAEAQYFIPKLKEVLRSLTGQELDDYVRLITTMLDAYLDYRLT